jgi:hypothetical protein
MPHILIVEDEAAITDTLIFALQQTVEPPIGRFFEAIALN